MLRLRVARQAYLEVCRFLLGVAGDESAGVEDSLLLEQYGVNTNTARI